MDNIILNYDEIDYDNFIFFSHFNEISNETSNEISNETSNETSNECINFILCKNNVYKNNNYCKPCFLYINIKLKHYKNIDNKICPICLSNESENIVVELFNCIHILCYECINNIYWKSDSILIQNPYPHLDKEWVKYIKSIESRRLRNVVLFRLIHNITADFNSLYKNLIKTINMKRIPKIFHSKLKELIFYQSQYEIIKNNEYNNKYIMRSSVKTCPLCRAEKLIIFSI